MLAQVAAPRCSSAWRARLVLLPALLLGLAGSEQLSGTLALRRGEWALAGVFGVDPGEGTFELITSFRVAGSELCGSTFSEITGGDLEVATITGGDAGALDIACCALCRMRSRCQFWVRSVGGVRGFEGTEQCWLKHTPEKTLFRQDRRGGWRQPAIDSVVGKFGLEALLVPAAPGVAGAMPWRELWKMRTPRPCAGRGGVDPRQLAPRRYTFDDLAAGVSLRQGPRQGMWYAVLSACGLNRTDGTDVLTTDWALHAMNNGSERSCDTRGAITLAFLALLVPLAALMAAPLLAPEEAPKRGVAAAALLAGLAAAGELASLGALPGAARFRAGAAAAAWTFEAAAGAALPLAALLSSLDGPRLCVWCVAASLHAVLEVRSSLEILGPRQERLPDMAPLVYLGRWRAQSRPLSVDWLAAAMLWACGASLLAWHRAGGDRPSAWAAGSLAVLGPPALRWLGQWAQPADAVFLVSAARPVLAGVVYWLLLSSSGNGRKAARSALFTAGTCSVLFGPSVTAMLYIAFVPNYQLLAMVEPVRPRLYMIAVTSRYNIPKARQLQASLQRRMGPSDRLAFACRGVCAKEAAGILQNIVRVPDLPDHLHNIRKCRHPKSKKDPTGKVCTEYEIASIKYVWALVGEVRRMVAGKLPNYKWWIIMDDDTYVHVPNIMRAVDKIVDGRPQHETLISFSNHEPGCPGICGGAGWLLSGALAERLVRDFGDEYIRFSMNQMYNGSFYYDVHVPRVVRWVKGARDVDLLEMMGFPPSDPICQGKGLKPTMRWKCVPSPACNCSKAALPGTWHLKGNITSHLAVLDATP